MGGSYRTSGLDSGESIYALIPEPIRIREKPPLYHSNHAGAINPSEFDMGVNSTRGKGTFGPATGKSKPKPQTFLKKYSKNPMLPDPTSVTNKKAKQKPPVPKKTEKPIMNLVSAKNFITANAVEAILSEAKTVKNREMNYTQKADYGKVPAYLARNKAKIAAEKAAIQEYMSMQEQQNQGDSMVEMPMEERENLKLHLKKKWAEINELYQKLSFTLDTPAKQKRKETYERELVQVENDIKKLNSRGPIYITED